MYPLQGLRILVFSLSLCITAAGQPPHPALAFTRLTSDLTVFVTWGKPWTEPYPANGVYLVTDAGVVLFDTPWDSTQFQPLLDSIRLRENQSVIMCLSTHFHADRTAGLSFYRARGIRTYTSVRTDSLLAAAGKGRAEYLFGNDTLFRIAGKNFRVFFPGEGHTKDNVVIWVDNDRALVAGCFIKDASAADAGYLGDANVREWPKSIRRMQTRFPHPRYVIPGHFGWQGDPVKHTLLLLEKEKQ